jgi:SET domain-containing protein
MNNITLVQQTAGLLAHSDSHRRSIEQSQSKSRLFVKESHGNLGLFTRDVINKGQVVISFSGRVVSFQQSNAKSLQLSSELFLRSNGEIDEYINHSCEPNCTVSFHGEFLPYLVAAREIAAGEEITLNYNCTEWDLLEQERVFQEDCAFACLCNSRTCLGEVRGFKYLSLHQQIRLSPHLSPFLRLKMMESLWLAQMNSTDAT